MQYFSLFYLFGRRSIRLFSLGGRNVVLQNGFAGVELFIAAERKNIARLQEGQIRSHAGNSQDKAAIIEAVMGGMKIAEKKGTAVMIGHIWSNDLANILTSMYPELVSQGFSLSTIADIATNGDFDE